MVIRPKRFYAFSIFHSLTLSAMCTVHAEVPMPTRAAPTANETEVILLSTRRRHNMYYQKEKGRERESAREHR